MGKLINFFEALIMFGGAIWGILYYTGHVGFKGERERRRLENIAKYGIVLLIGVVLCFLGGTILLMGTFFCS